MGSSDNSENGSLDVGALIKQLGSRNATKRQRAEEALRQLSPEGVKELVRLARNQPKKTMIRMVTWFAVIFWPMVMLPAWVSFGMGSVVPDGLRELIFFAFLIAYGPLFLSFVAKPRFHNNLIWSLTLVEDVQVLGPLIRSASVERIRRLRLAQALNKVMGVRSGLAGDVKAALLRTLQRFQPGEEIDITSVERSSLRVALYGSDPKVVLGLLGLLERIGGSQDLPTLRKLESGAVARTDPAVREAAQTCLAAIEARLADQAVVGTLLRASESSVATETLVRPVITTVPVEPTQLLRASRHDDRTQAP